MKKGDIVMINDGSWSRVVRNNKLTDGPNGDEYKASLNKYYNRKQYVVIETGCSFPSTGNPSSFNNTVIQAVGSGKVVFIEERFLKLVPPKHMIMIDIKRDVDVFYGSTIKISDKLYKEIKRETQTKQTHTQET